MKLSIQNRFTTFLHPGCESGGLHHAGFHLTYVYLSLLLLLVIPDGSVEACHFPDYIQKSVNGSENVRDWSGLIRNQNREATLKYEFRNDVLMVNSTDTKIKSFSRICIQAYPDDKYLVAHEEPGQATGLYLCMQIVRRSDSVIQIKQSESTTRLSNSLCSNENLHLDGWLIIDNKSVLNQRVDCALIGGFNMQVYDMSTHTPVCDGNLGETRLESECLPGEGLNFYFRQAACVPDGLYMYPTQRTYCLANWETDRFNFILIKHDRMTSLWVLRYPKEGDSKFTALLMKDIYATGENSITATNEYIRIVMSRQSPKTLDHLCYDDYEICSVLSDPCSYSEDIARTCAKTCGFCSDSRPSVCQLDSSIRGTWLDSNQPDAIADIKINASSLHISGSETLHCIDWSNGISQTTETSSKETGNVFQQIVATVSSNGCRPRFSCAEFTVLTNTMFMKLSQTKMWPLVQNKIDNYTCDNFLYATNRDIDMNPYRKKLSTLLVPNIDIANVSVDLGEFQNFDVRFKGRIMCSGQLIQGSQNRTMQFHLENCPEKSLDNIEFAFLEFAPLPFASPDNDMLLITRTNNRTPITNCWLFPEKTDDVFHMLASEECNGAMKRKIRKGRLRPIATFRKALPWIVVTEMVIEEKTNHNLKSTIQQDTNTHSNQESNTVTGIMNSSDILLNTSSRETNTSNVVVDENNKPSLLAIFGIIVSFITVTFGIYCSCTC